MRFPRVCATLFVSVLQEKATHGPNFPEKLIGSPFSGNDVNLFNALYKDHFTENFGRGWLVGNGSTASLGRGALHYRKRISSVTWICTDARFIGVNSIDLLTYICSAQLN